MGRWRPRPNRRKHCAPSIRLYSHCGRGQCRATCGADRVGLYRTCGRRAFQNCAKWRWNSAVGSKKRRWAKGKGIYFSLTGCRLPKGLYTSLYQCIQPEIPRADVYLNCSILKKEFPLHFDEGSTPEKSALLNLHVDWGHLVLIIQTAPDFPIKKLAKELADACEMEGRIFSGHTKRL